MRAVPVITLAWATVALLQLQAFGADAELLLPSGQLVSGTPHFSSGKLRVGTATVRGDEIVSLRLSDIPIERTIDSGVALVSGDVLSGTVETIQAGKVALTSDRFRQVTFPLAAVNSIALVPRQLSDMVGVDGATAGAELTNGDVVTGELEWINEKFVGINNGRRIVRMPRGRTSFIRLGASADKTRSISADQGRQYARLLSGDRISGRLVSLDTTSMTIETSYAGTLSVPTSAVSEIWSEGGQILPISRLEPSTAKHIPQFDDKHPHKVDRNALGGFLTVGGRVYERGLGCHSRSEIDFALGGKYSAFVAEIGIDDGANGHHRGGGPLSGVVFQVLADGRMVFESEVILGGQSAKPIHVELSGASRLRLVVDFGPGGVSFGDHADWCHAVLVK